MLHDVKVDARVSDTVWYDCVAIMDCGPTHEVSKSANSLPALCIPRYNCEVLRKNNVYGYNVDLFKLQLVVDRWLSVYGLTVYLSFVVSSLLDK